MTTSLSRQLSQLRATSHAISTPTSSVFSSGPFLISESDSLDERQLLLLAQDSFQTLTEQCQYLKKFQKDIFDDEEADEKMEDDSHPWQEDVLLLLTPHVLSTPGQFLLQYLVSKHKIHATHSEMLFWSTLPFFEYKIFQRVLSAIAASPSAKYPQWFEAFQRACQPATAVGLRKHLAGDRGFFKMLCDLVLRTKTHQIEYREANYDEVLYFFCSNVLGALQNLSGLSEFHTYNLMQIVVAGIKSDHSEFFALGATLAAKLFPTMRMKAKVALKMLKVMKKKCNKVKNEQTLALSLILFKSQFDVVDKTKVIKILAKHEDTFKEIFADMKLKEDDEVDYAKRVLANLTLLCTCIASKIAVSDDVAKLISILEEGVKVVDLPRDTAVSLIKSVSQCYAVFKKMKKKAKKRGDDTRRRSSVWSPS